MLSVYDYEVFENKDKKKFLAMNSSYAAAYPRGAIFGTSASP